MKDDLNDKFVWIILGAGAVTGVMTGSIAVGFFTALGLSAACVYTGMIRF